MYTYRWRLARPGWLAGAAATALAVAVTALVLGWADDVTGTLFTGHWINLVVAATAAAPLRDPAAAVLDATPYSRRRRRLAPAGCALLAAALWWAAFAAAQARRVPGVPWAGLALETAGMCVVACATGMWCIGHADPGVTGSAVVALLLLFDGALPFGPWLTAEPGPHWAAGRTAWAALAAAGLVAVLARSRNSSHPR
ncbi:hypothetical protein [Actinoplanes sp. NPDC026619]|uniref:hypothetical protein n=1 Tax=Actinoplanes sp. NPDC026619 TaxID=3155798 RepID=UPI0034106385